MKKMMARMAAGAAVATMMAAGPVFAQQSGANIAPPSASNSASTSQNFTDNQLLTLTVHQAWVRSGKNEANFFAMVTQLAELSAQNRDLKLPESAAAGQRVGEMIKEQAKKDTDQLLYAVVDAAVRKVGTPISGSGS